MKEEFKVKDGDMGLVITLKREANYKLASLKSKEVSDEEYTTNYNLLKDSINIAKAIENIEPSNFEDVNYIVDSIKRCWNGGLLSPLTLNDNEFSSVIVNGKYYNERYRYIYKSEEGDIRNEYMYNMFMYKYYNHNDNKELNLKKDVLHKSERLYFSKGGVITGDYIREGIIKKEYVDRHSFTPQILRTNVSVIIDNNKAIYTIDHRSPELKQMEIWYDIPVYHDDEVAKAKYNIRKYVKLNK